eukprot:14965172-Alexandrium_andersonii.AAC.1
MNGVLPRKRWAKSRRPCSRTAPPSRTEVCGSGPEVRRGSAQLNPLKPTSTCLLYTSPSPRD